MNNYNSNTKAINESQKLGYDRDLIVVKDVLLCVKGNEYVYGDWFEKPNTSHLKLHTDLSESPVAYPDLLKPPARRCKTSFLVFKNQKYTTVNTRQIAFFYIKNECTSIMCFDKQEFTLHKSLDQIANAVSSEQFFRVNRRYLINFNAIKEVEHYFLRKLFVRLFMETPDKLLINKEKTHSFLTWMEDR